MFAIEVKTPDGRMRQEQDEFLLNIVKHGGVAAVVRSLRDIQVIIGARDA
jgi:hypothetical protein